MRSFYYRYRSSMWLIIFFIAILIILSSVKKRGKRSQNSIQKDRGLFRFDSNTRQIQVRNLKGELILQGNMGIKIDPSYAAPEESVKNGLHYTWGDHVILSITREAKNCLLVDWDSISDEPFTPLDCFSLGKSMWYGGGELKVPSWPTNKASVEMSPFYPKRYSGAAKANQKHYRSVVEPYWLSSSGVAIYVDDLVPLHVSFNVNGDHKLCLKADTTGYPGHQKPIHLLYRLCFGSNLKTTHTYMTSRFFNKPHESFSKSIMRYPVCTLKSPSQDKLERFFNGIVIRQFACGHIDLGLQQNLEFNNKAFHQPMSLIQRIHSKKMSVLVTVNSFFSNNSNAYREVPKEFLIMEEGGGAINFAKNKITNWFLEKVKGFQSQYHIDKLRFNGGEVQFPVDDYHFGKDENPGMVVHNFAKVASKVGKSFDIEVGYKTQSLPLIIKLMDRQAQWGREMGLRSIISMVLSIGILGYPFVTLGPIGGNTQGNEKPGKELYIRWMQLSVFFPVMEFSIYPWEYDEETVHLSAEILDIRSTLLDKIIMIAKQSVDTGAPVVRPMWWISPNDPNTHIINTQFMLGDIYLVSPVLWEKKQKHDVYLPKGVWREMFGKGRKHEIEIGQWLTFDIELRTIVYFECLLC